jgi:hypothetical protein
VALVIGGLLVAGFVASEVDAFREAPALRPVAAVSDPADGCQRFLALFSGLLRDKPDDAEAERQFEQLRDAARDNDPLLASDMQDILNGDGAADVSAATQIIVRRCAAAGHITQDDVNRLGAAAMSAMGAATAEPQRPAATAPPPVVEPYAVDELSPGEPTCADVLPILKKHPNDMREWLEYFEGGGVAGTPWAPGDYVTLYSLSPKTGDPIRQTLTVSNGLLDDYDLNPEAEGEDVPNRVLIYLVEDGVACADGP